MGSKGQLQVRAKKEDTVDLCALSEGNKSTRQEMGFGTFEVSPFHHHGGAEASTVY